MCVNGKEPEFTFVHPMRTATLDFVFYTDVCGGVCGGGSGGGGLCVVGVWKVVKVRVVCDVCVCV